MNIKDFYYFWAPLGILIKSKCNIIHERDTRKTDGTARKRIPSAQTRREIRTPHVLPEKRILKLIYGLSPGELSWPLFSRLPLPT